MSGTDGMESSRSLFGIMIYLYDPEDNMVELKGPPA